MKPQTIRLADIAPQPWRNGGGRTRELLRWPHADDWSVRISVADIESDGPFSAFAGVQRWLATVRGDGVALAFADGERRLRPGDEPLRFDGAAAPQCRLVGGPTLDLNLMLRHGRGRMQSVQAGELWRAPFAMRGLFTAVPGRWSNGGEPMALQADTLLWSADPGETPWRFEPAAGPEAAPARAWWLGYTPQESRP